MYSFEINGKKMVIFFYIIIVSFFIAVTYFLYINDFNNKTIHIIFPTIGAILLSVYLGVKEIWIDAPPAVVQKTNVFIAYDATNGVILPIGRNLNNEPIDYTYKFRGIKNLSIYQKYTALKDLPEWNLLKSNDICQSNKIIGNLLEYSILDWLSEPYTLIGYTDTGTVTLLGGAGGSSGLIPKDLIHYTINAKKEDWNPLLKAKSITLHVPKGTKVIRDKYEQFGMKFSIHTNNTVVKFEAVHCAFSSLPKYPYLQDIELMNKFGINNKNEHIKLLGITINLEASFKKPLRFSDQSTLEQKWATNLFKLFNEDYSWELFRDYMISA
ncbi:MAG: hypothetical protein DBP02_16680 [gamma proteobacterium symbiont of Ctena orbiculata]|nr:MAG: hypothetical protein DBP02_16680 [gamma proteobacterium symbiont of Ctena orbiculata]